jgi:hypothetical protein
MIFHLSSNWVQQTSLLLIYLVEEKIKFTRLVSLVQRIVYVVGNTIREETVGRTLMHTQNSSSTDSGYYSSKYL